MGFFINATLLTKIGSIVRSNCEVSLLYFCCVPEHVLEVGSTLLFLCCVIYVIRTTIASDTSLFLKNC